MPVIRSSADLRNNYSEISEYCKAHNQPVFITINGKGDLAVMSIERYEKLNELAAKFELYEQLEVGLNAIKNGDVMSLDDARAQLKKRYEKI